MKFLAGVFVGICLVVVAGYFFVIQGGIAMSTDAKPFPLERLLAHKALAASIGKSEDEKSPLPADETNLLAGAEVFKQSCAGCHGQFGQGASGLSKRVYPHIPPLLPPSKGVTDDPVGETHWVIKNGIRFSAMPSFGTKLNDNQIWQVSVLLHQADKLPAAVQEALGSKK